MNGKKAEDDTSERAGVVENRRAGGKTFAEKKLPSPSASSSSHDTGFGSQEGEGSIDGKLEALASAP